LLAGRHFEVAARDGPRRVVANDLEVQGIERECAADQVQQEAHAHVIMIREEKRRLRA
jgi:hypothetical protein